MSMVILRRHPQLVACRVVHSHMHDHTLVNTKTLMLVTRYTLALVEDSEFLWPGTAVAGPIERRDRPESLIVNGHDPDGISQWNQLADGSGSVRPRGANVERKGLRDVYAL